LKDSQTKQYKSCIPLKDSQMYFDYIRFRV
jgi:hypothetical protein